MPQLWQSVRFHAEAHKMLWIPRLCCCSKSSNINTILFSHTSGCHSDKASPCALHPEVNLKGCKQPECDSGGGNVPPRSAAGLTALSCWQIPMEEISWLFILELNAPRSLLDFSSSHVFHPISHFLWFHLTYRPSCLSHLRLSAALSWFSSGSVGAYGGGGGVSEQSQDKGCTLSFFCYSVSKAFSPAWLPCALLCGGAWQRSLRAVTHLSFFPTIAGRREREEESFLFTLEPCLCFCSYNCVYLLWAVPVCAEHFFNLTSL